MYWCLFTPVIVNQMKKGAYYITSGILDVKEEVVVKAVKDTGLQLVEVTHRGRMGICHSQKGIIMQRFFVEPYRSVEEEHRITLTGRGSEPYEKCSSHAHW